MDWSRATFESLRSLRGRATRCTFATFVTCYVLFEATALASEPELKRTNEFLWAEFGVTSALGLGSLFLPKPSTCVWCGTNSFDRGARSALVWEQPKDARLASDITVGAILPLSAIAFATLPSLVNHERKHALQNLPIVTSAFVTSFVLTQVTKVLAGRLRPGCAMFATSGISGTECNVSFFSGHTAAGFSLAASTTTLLALRGQGIAPVAGVLLGSLATTGALLRMMGDAHWATDVLVGMSVGTAVGITMPLLLHPRDSSSSAVSTPATSSTNLTIVPAANTDAGIGFAGAF